MVDNALIARLLMNLDGYLHDLREQENVGLDAFRTDIRLQRYIERTLHIAIECCMDICHHIISDQQLREPSSYADAFNVLAEQDILPADTAAKCRLMAQFRNKLVHYYEKIEPEQVLAILHRHLNDFAEFAGGIRRWVQQHPLPAHGE